MRKNLALFILCVLLMSLSSSGLTDLLGELSQEDIIASFPSWEERAAGYMPDLDSITKLQALDVPVQIEVFLGTWCPDSIEHVSSFFKILDMTDNPLLMVTYTGLPRDKEAREVYIQGKNIKKIPTFIFYLNNQEIGRIIEHPNKTIEKDMADILANIN